MENILVLARTGLISAVARRGHGQDPEVVLYHLMSFFWGQLLLHGRGSSWVMSVPSVMDTVPVTVHSSYSSTVSSEMFVTHLLPFLPSILLFIPLQGRQECVSALGKGNIELGNIIPKPRPWGTVFILVPG